MNMIYRKYFKALAVAAFTLVAFNLTAKENIKDPLLGKTNTLKKRGAGCLPATQQRDLDINNVRTTILNGGDMWWNLQNARYEIPKVEPGQVSKHSLFSGALWIGGITEGNLRIAAQTYRQSGNDYYPGALLVDGSASITPERCKFYDKIYKVTLAEIDEHRANPGPAWNPNENIASWPGNGNTIIGEAQFLAPFVNVDADPLKYSPELGDYPAFDQNNPRNIPDMMLYTIYNDKGNIHSESDGLPLGIELHTQSFGYQTNDEINNMTFYRTTVFNRGSETIDSCIFGQWVDPDLGNYTDDYVECDVQRNLGICYNGDDNDEGILGYGLNPPSVGVNFFEGPRRPDSSEIGLSKFVYYNNDFSVTGNPRRPEHYWNYLNGRWTDGLPITYGGNGRNGTDTASYMFPGLTDPARRPEWTERTAGNQPADRRFLQTAGPFSLLPGAVNRVTVAVVWARATTGGATGSFNLLKQASDRAFVLFKNNFTLIDGPDAPDMIVTELDRSIVLTLTNYQRTENYIDSTTGLCAERSVFKFQGYQIYQLKRNSFTNLNNPEEAKLVAQCDIIDGASLLVNTFTDPDVGSVRRVMVNGENKGVRHSFRIEKDLFSTASDPTLINFQNYYYTVVAYASNDNCSIDDVQYLAGRKNIKVYEAVPHKPFARNQGTNINSTYGDGPEITRIEGIGNSGNIIRLNKKTIEKALVAPYFDPNPTYAKGFGPITVKVVDPFKIPFADFELRMEDTSASTTKNVSLTASATRWILKNLVTGEEVKSETSIDFPNEQVFTKWGLTITVNQAIMPGDALNIKDETNGFIDAEMEFSNPSLQWLMGVPDELAPLPAFNWIRAGNTGTPQFNNPFEHDFATGPGAPIDPRRQFNRVLNGTWAPYGLAARAISPQPTHGPAWAAGGNGGYSSDNPLSDLNSIELVITPDKSKWTRCIVVETGEDRNLTVGNVEKLNRRESPSIGKDGRPDGDGNGKSWFPGYAVNLETGERLNIMFGEDSSLPQEQGNDMIWNPTKNFIDTRTGQILFGGKHFIYIMNNKPFRLTPNGPIRFAGVRYDEGKAYDSIFNLVRDGVSAIINKRCIFSQAMWVNIPIITQNGYLLSMKDGLVPNEVTIRINVKRPFATYISQGETAVNAGQPFYKFSTSSLAPNINDVKSGQLALDKVSVTPNPYYAYSGYEDPGNQLDNRVRITNLPANCIVSIYTQGGYLVRRIRKDDNTRTFIDWDLKNDANVPISSGIYLVHVYAPGLGERVIKWFGVMRKTDFDTF